jgi:hypothetical protein
MKKYLMLLVLLLVSFCMADIRFTGSSFSDESTYLTSYGVKALFLVNELEYSLNAERNQSPVRTNDRLWAGIDGDVSKTTSWFVFDSNDNGTWRQGVGVGYEFNDNILTYPYKHKVSMAIVHDSSRYGIIPSIRYKFQGYFSGFGLASTTFLLGYTYTEDYVISYKLNTVVSIIYKGYFDDASKVNQSAMGVEVKI